jgi:integrase
MAITPRGNTFQVNVGSGADRFRVSAKTMEEAVEVERREILKRQKAALGVVEEKPAARAEVTMGRLLELAKRRIWLNASDTQSENAERVLAVLGERTSVHEINRDTLRELVETFYEMGNSGATINRKMSALSVMLKVAEDEEWIERAPKIPRQTEAKHRVRFYDAAEEKAMLRVCHQLGMPDLADFIVLGIDTGFRKSEILGLAIRDCEGENAVLHAGETKSGNARSVTLTTRCREMVQRRKGFTTLFENLTLAQLRRQWDILRHAMGKEDDEFFIVHVLRHTCASRLAMMGRPAQFIQAWMGHSTIMVSQRYMHLCPNTLKDGVVSLDDYRLRAA